MLPAYRDKLFDVALLARVVKARVLPPPPSLKISEWVEAARRLPAGSAEPGPLKVSRTPYAKEIMDAVCDPSVETVVWQASAQVSKTETALSVILYYLTQDPSPVMFVMPSSGVAEAFSKERVASAITNTVGLAELTVMKSRVSESTILYKPFTNGASLVLAGSESPSQLASRPRRVVICDEIDKYPASAGSEGDPVSLALKRTMTYAARKKHFLISTPSVKGESRIETAYLESDQRKYYVPCPHCQVKQVLIWANVKWETGKPEDATYLCRHCETKIEHHHKTWMLANGEWRAHAKTQTPGLVGFHISELYSPWSTWGKMAQEFVVKLEQGPEIYKTFINSSLGEVYDPAYGTEAKVEGLLARARACKYASGVVPSDAGLLVASADTQDDRLEVLVQAIMPGGRIHTVQHRVIEGNLALAEPWDRLQKFITQPWKREDGKPMKIRKFCIDHGGHYSAEVMAFCKRKSVLGLAVPIKGSSTAIVGTVKQSKKRSKLWIVDTTALKDSMYSDLKIETVGAPGHQSFYYDIEGDLFGQLLSERKVKGGQGSRKYEVFPKGSRNEMADLYCYCRAALKIFKPLPGEVEKFAEHYKDMSPPPAPLDPKETFEEVPEEEVPPVPEPAISHPPRNKIQPRVRSIRNPRERKGPLGF